MTLLEEEPKLFLKKLLIFENVRKCPHASGDVYLKSIKGGHVAPIWIIYNLRNRTPAKSMLHESYKLSGAEVLKHFNCDAIRGLESSQVQEAKAKFGLNGIEQ